MEVSKQGDASARRRAALAIAALAVCWPAVARAMGFGDGRLVVLAGRGPDKGGTGVGGLLKVVHPAVHGMIEQGRHSPGSARRLAEQVIKRWRHLKRPPTELYVSVQDFQEGLAVDVLRHRLERGLPGVKVKIGFQLHIPWRTGHATEPILGLLQRSLLEADVLAFQHAAHIDAFVAHAEQALGYSALRSSSGGHRLHVPARGDGRAERRPLLVQNPVSISGDEFQAISRDPVFRATFDEYRAKYDGRVVFEMGGRVDMTKGWEEFLDAASLALERHPELARKAVFVLATAPTREDRAEYAALYRRVVGRIEQLAARYADHGTFELHKSGLPYVKFMALHAAANVILLPSPNGEGMGLPPLEATAMAHLTGTATVPLVSHKATVGRYLGGSVRVDPYRAEAFANEIVALSRMSGEQRRAIHSRNLDDARSQGLLYSGAAQTSNFVATPFELLDASR